MPQHEFTITDGPCKQNLLTAFGNAYGGKKSDEIDTVYFHFFIRQTLGENKAMIHTRIFTLQHIAPGSGDSWKFTGIAEMPSGYYERITGRYNTHDRTGNFSINPR